MDASGTDRTIDARLATLSPGDAETIARRPRSTIVPPERAAESMRDRALAVLRALDADHAEPLRVERTLGEGGMGVVQLATQTSMGRAVAVKTLRAGQADDVAALRLLREAWVTGSLEHPNIVPVYDVAIGPDGAPQVVLKRIDGVDWATLLSDRAALAARSGGDAAAWNLRILMQVASAVHFAHDRGIIHRDLKPENVMLGRFDEVYVVDWGIAVSLRDDGDPRLPRVADARDLAGTPSYMAPEMLTGDPSQLGPRTDVYLLGAVLFELFAGHPPHEGPTLEALFSKILSSPPEMPHSIPPELGAVCRRAMARDPAERYDSVGDFRRAIAEYLEHRESMRLAHQAQRRLTELLEEIAERSDAPGDDDRVHHLFGECRFGLRAALDAWPGNEVAKGALRLALKAMAEHELASGNAKAARVLIGELGDAPPELARGLAELERRTAADSAERARLEALHRDHDPRTGSRTRTVIALILGATWTALPVALHVGSDVSERGPDPTLSLAVAAGSLPLVLGLGYWARESMMKTVLNRRMFAVLVFVLLSHLALGAACRLAGVPAAATVSLNFFLWFVAAGLSAIMLERRAWPTALTFLVCLFASIAAPRWILLIMAASQAALTLNAVAIWGPLALDSAANPGRRQGG